MSKKAIFNLLISIGFTLLEFNFILKIKDGNADNLRVQSSLVKMDCFFIAAGIFFIPLFLISAFTDKTKHKNENH